MDKYALALHNLMSLKTEEYEQIPACDADVVLLHDTTKIISKEQAWLYDLCKAISLSKETSAYTQRPWPRFIPKQAIKKGGEAFLLTATDQWREQVVLLKIPLPIFSISQESESNKSEPQKSNKSNESGKINEPQKPDKSNEPSKIVKGAGVLLELGKKLYQHRRLEPPKKVEKREISRDVERFRRSFMLQKQLHKISKQMNAEGGYVPDVYEFADPPACYFSQEYIVGESYVDWIRGHTDKEILELFLKIVVFVEKALHGYGVAHCDIAPRNLLVIDNTPVLLDFGISKVEKLPEITVESAQLGSLLFSSPRQLQDSKERGYLDDIFSLGRLLWVTLTRREPSLEGILASYVDNKLVYDAEVISALFDQFSIPHSFSEFRGVFNFSQIEEGYQEISEFRSDLEKIIYLNKPKPVCQQLKDLQVEVESGSQQLKDLQVEVESGSQQLKDLQVEVKLLKKIIRIMNGEKI